MMQKIKLNKKLCIVAGGSGGHISPAIVLGKQWKEKHRDGRAGSALLGETNGPVRPLWTVRPIQRTGETQRKRQEIVPVHVPVEVEIRTVVHAPRLRRIQRPVKAQRKREEVESVHIAASAPLTASPSSTLHPRDTRSEVENQAFLTRRPAHLHAPEL